MSLRDYFAAQVAIAILVHQKIEPSASANAVAEYAYRYADAMLKERAK